MSDEQMTEREQLQKMLEQAKREQTGDYNDLNLLDYICGRLPAVNLVDMNVPLGLLLVAFEKAQEEVDHRGAAIERLEQKLRALGVDNAD